MFFLWTKFNKKLSGYIRVRYMELKKYKYKTFYDISIVWYFHIPKFNPSMFIGSLSSLNESSSRQA
jgi:hypothetical protein